MLKNIYSKTFLDFQQKVKLVSDEFEDQSSKWFENSELGISVVVKSILILIDGSMNYP